MRHQRTSLLCPLISIFRKCTSLSVVPVGKIIPPRQSQKGQREQGHLVGQACPLGGVRGQELSSAADPGGHAGSGWAALPTTTTHTGPTGSVLPDHPLCVSRAVRRTYFLPLSFLSTPKTRLQSWAETFFKALDFRFCRNEFTPDGIVHIRKSGQASLP